MEDKKELNPEIVEAEEQASKDDGIEAQLAEAHDKYLRALADLENYKKRAIKERSDLIKYQGERIFQDLLDVVDNFELALKHSESDPAQLKAGVQMIYKLFQDLLNRWEVKSESAIGQVFDPNKHNAISKISVDDAAVGSVVNELKKAYFYKDKLLRAAEVVVADEKDKDE